MRYFNTVGAIHPDKHYFLPHRLDWNKLEEFIEKEYYFVLHAPRQSGKTTAIIEFVCHLNRKSDYKSLYLSIEAARTSVEDVTRAIRIILQEFKRKIAIFLPQELEALAYLEKKLKNAESDESDLLEFLTKNR